MESIFGQSLITSASWCPPCRQFFPTLLSFYNTVNQSSKQVEIIWISRDRSLDDFNSVRKNCPWLAVPYEQEKIESILQRYDIDVIPKLYLLNRDGSLAHTECRQEIVSKGPAAINDWLRIRN